MVVIGNHKFHAQFTAWADTTAASVPLHVLDDGSMSDEDKLGALGLELQQILNPYDRHMVLRRCARQAFLEAENSELVRRALACGCDGMTINWPDWVTG